MKVKPTQSTVGRKSKNRLECWVQISFVFSVKITLCVRINISYYFSSQFDERVSIIICRYIGRLHYILQLIKSTMSLKYIIITINLSKSFSYTEIHLSMSAYAIVS